MKRGISLIVLVITIIVMIILAASVVITLSNTNIINKANQGVDLNNEKQVQELATIIWMDAYLDEAKKNNITTIVKQELANQGVTEDKWNIIVTENGVDVINKTSIQPLGSLITPDNYGDTVDYVVTVDGTKYDKWEIYYHNSEYVYLISAENVGNTDLITNYSVTDLTEKEKELYDIFRVGEFEKFILADRISNNDANSSKAVVKLIKDYSNFANAETYGENVVGAIGGPTIELLVAGWNAKGYQPKIEITLGPLGYKINGGASIGGINGKKPYVSKNNYVWMASPVYSSLSGVMSFSSSELAYAGYTASKEVQPVICLKASILAKVGTTTDFTLIK